MVFWLKVVICLQNKFRGFYLAEFLQQFFLFCNSFLLSFGCCFLDSESFLLFLVLFAHIQCCCPLDLMKLTARDRNNVLSRLQNLVDQMNRFQAGMSTREELHKKTSEINRLNFYRENDCI